LAYLIGGEVEEKGYDWPQVRKFIENYEELKKNCEIVQTWIEDGQIPEENISDIKELFGKEVYKNPPSDVNGHVVNFVKSFVNFWNEVNETKDDKKEVKLEET